MRLTPIIGALACMGLASAAAAADFGGSLKDDYSAPAGHNWTGCYLGLHGGYGWGEWDGHMIYTDAKPNDGFDSSGKTIDLDGGLVGGQAGCNLQLGNFILGIEGDIAHSGIDGGKTFLPYPNGSNPPSWTFDLDVNWIATARGRIGFSTGPMLLYLTGGLAWADLESALKVHGNGHNAFGSVSDTKDGWVVGGGFEYAATENWTLKVEYQYLDFGSFGGIHKGTQFTAPACKETGCPHTTDGFDGDVTLHTVRIGANYRFGR